MWVYTIYTMVDGIFVARGVGKEALAAVNISMPLINVAFALGILFAVGASTKASIYKGQNNGKKADRVFTLSTVTVACVGLIVAAVVMLNLTDVYKRQDLRFVDIIRSQRSAGAGAVLLHMACNERSPGCKSRF